MVKRAKVTVLRKTFAVRLRELIQQEAGAQKLKSFAKKTGCPMETLSLWQNQERSDWPSVKNLIKLVYGTGKSADWFLFGEEMTSTSLKEYFDRRAASLTTEEERAVYTEGMIKYAASQIEKSQKARAKGARATLRAR